MGERLAVVIFNLGGPDSLAAVRPFLFNLFNDPNILTMPQPLRWMVARLISTLRAEKSRKLYASIGGRSPLLEETQAQAAALESSLLAEGRDARVFVFMRYWHPLAAACVQAVKAYAPTRVILLPLYPQFSTTTTGTSFTAFRREAARQGLNAPIDAVCCYPTEGGFIDAIAQDVRAAYQREGAGEPRVIFTAHGLPEKIIAAGDPYQWQVENTAALIAERTDIAGLDWKLCYQSRVGPVQWIGPSIEDTVRAAGRDGVPIIVVPIAFVSEHVETLVELDRDMRALAREVGVPRFTRLATVRTHDLYISALARLVRDCRGLCSGSGGRLCPGTFTRCPNRTAADQASG